MELFVGVLIAVSVAFLSVYLFVALLRWKRF
jgi:hypothetical protein